MRGWLVAILVVGVVAVPLGLMARAARRHEGAGDDGGTWDGGSEIDHVALDDGQHHDP